MLPLPRGAIWQTFFLLSVVLFINEVRSEGRVVCYYTNWSVYRPGTAKFNPQNINPYLCTHLVYAFGGFTKDNQMKPFDKYQDIEQGGYAKFTGLKTYNKQLKTMIAIGGWNEASSRFSPLVASPERRQKFIKNILKFLRQNHFDGIDLDWEYPAHREGGKERDRDNYAQFVQELRAEFEREAEKTGRPRLLLTMAVPAGIEYIEKGYDIPKLNKYLDWFNLLTYDFHSSHEPSVNHHAPLYSLEEESEYNYDTELNIDYSLKFYLKAGADRDKLVLGIPTYGRSFTLINEDSTEIGAPAEGPGEQGDATREKGYLAYYEICQNLKDDPEWTVVKPNSNAMGPYAYRRNQWVGYDDEDIVRKKAQYAVEHGLGGIMFWAIDNDDFRGTCSGKPYPLIEAAKEAMLEGLGVGINEVTNSLPKKALRSRSRENSQSPRNRIGDSDRKGTTRRPVSASRKQSTTELPKTVIKLTEVEGSSLYIGGRTTTPPPPTTPDPGTDFKCEEEGFFQHPRDCKKYYWCLDSGPSGLGIVGHQFTCPSGLYFNPAADSCDFARNVPCKIKKSTTSAPTTTTSTTPQPTTASNRVTSATSRNTFLRTTTTRRKTTTSTEAPVKEEEEETIDYEEEEETAPAQHKDRDPEEDPKVIKELIDLIRKVGGIEELEKHLLRKEDGSISLKEQSSAVPGIATTPSSIAKTLYDKVLSRPNTYNSFRNRLTSSTLYKNNAQVRADEESSGRSKYEEEYEQDEEVGRSSSGYSKYSSVVRSNSRQGPQNEGLENLSESEGFLKEKKQYVTINRNRGTAIGTQYVADEDDEREEENNADEEVSIAVSEASENSAHLRGASTPVYNSIRRTKVITQSSDPDEDEELKEQRDNNEKKIYATLNRTRGRFTTTEIPSTVTNEGLSTTNRYKYFERTRPTKSSISTKSSDDEESADDEAAGEDQQNVTVQFTAEKDSATQITQHTRLYASVGHRSTTSSAEAASTETPTTTTPTSKTNPLAENPSTETPEPISITAISPSTPATISRNTNLPEIIASSHPTASIIAISTTSSAINRVDSDSELYYDSTSTLATSPNVGLKSGDDSLPDALSLDLNFFVREPRPTTESGPDTTNQDPNADPSASPGAAKATTKTLTTAGTTDITDGFDPDDDKRYQFNRSRITTPRITTTTTTESTTTTISHEDDSIQSIDQVKKFDDANITTIGTNSTESTLGSRPPASRSRRIKVLRYRRPVGSNNTTLINSSNNSITSVTNITDTTLDLDNSDSLSFDRNVENSQPVILNNTRHLETTPTETEIPETPRHLETTPTETEIPETPSYVTPPTTKRFRKIVRRLKRPLFNQSSTPDDVPDESATRAAVTVQTSTVAPTTAAGFKRRKESRYNFNRNKPSQDKNQQINQEEINAGQKIPPRFSPSSRRTGSERKNIASRTPLFSKGNRVRFNSRGPTSTTETTNTEPVEKHEEKKTTSKDLEETEDHADHEGHTEYVLENNVTKSEISLKEEVVGVSVTDSPTNVEQSEVKTSEKDSEDDLVEMTTEQSVDDFTTAPKEEEVYQTKTSSNKENSLQTILDQSKNTDQMNFGNTRVSSVPENETDSSPSINVADEHKHTEVTTSRENLDLQKIRNKVKSAQLKPNANDKEDGVINNRLKKLLLEKHVKKANVGEDDDESYALEATTPYDNDARTTTAELLAEENIFSTASATRSNDDEVTTTTLEGKDSVEATVETKKDNELKEVETTSITPETTPSTGSEFVIINETEQNNELKEIGSTADADIQILTSTSATDIAEPNNGRQLDTTEEAVADYSTTTLNALVRRRFMPSSKKKKTGKELNTVQENPAEAPSTFRPTPKRKLVDKRPYIPRKPTLSLISTTPRVTATKTRNKFVPRKFGQLQPPSNIDSSQGNSKNSQLPGVNRFKENHLSPKHQEEDENVEDEDEYEDDSDPEEDENEENKPMESNVKKSNEQTSKEYEDNDEDGEEDEDDEDYDGEDNDKHLENTDSHETVAGHRVPPGSRPGKSSTNVPFNPRNRQSPSLPNNTNRPRVVNRPVLSIAKPVKLEFEPSTLPTVTKPAPFIPSHTPTYERKYSGSSTTDSSEISAADDSLEDLNIEAINARNKKIFDINSKKHTTLKPKLFTNHDSSEQDSDEQEPQKQIITTHQQPTNTETITKTENKVESVDGVNQHNNNTYYEGREYGFITTTPSTPTTHLNTDLTFPTSNEISPQDIDDSGRAQQMPTTTVPPTTTLLHVFTLTDDDGHTNRPIAASDNFIPSESDTVEPKHKVVEINRIVEITSKEDKLRRKSKANQGLSYETVGSTSLKVESLPHLEQLGEISVVKYVHLVNGDDITIDGHSAVADYTPTESSATAAAESASRRSPPVRNSVPEEVIERHEYVRAASERKAKSLVPEVILEAIETSTIPLEGLFDSARKGKELNASENVVYDYKSSQAPSTELRDSTKGSPIIGTGHQNATSSTYDAADHASAKPSTVAAALFPAYVRPIVPLLRPESNESSPLVISIANLDKVILSKVGKVNAFQPASDSSAESSSSHVTIINPPTNHFQAQTIDGKSSGSGGYSSASSVGDVSHSSDAINSNSNDLNTNRSNNNSATNNDIGTSVNTDSNSRIQNRLSAVNGSSSISEEQRTSTDTLNIGNNTISRRPVLSVRRRLINSAATTTTNTYNNNNRDITTTDLPTTPTTTSKFIANSYRRSRPASSSSPTANDIPQHQAQQQNKYLANISTANRRKYQQRRIIATTTTTKPTSNDESATEQPRTQNPLFKRRYSHSLTTSRPQLTSAATSSTMMLAHESLTTTLYVDGADNEEASDQVAKSSIHSSLFNRIPDDDDDDVADTNKKLLSNGIKATTNRTPTTASSDTLPAQMSSEFVEAITRRMDTLRPQNSAFHSASLDSRSKAQRGTQKLITSTTQSQLPQRGVDTFVNRRRSHKATESYERASIDRKSTKTTARGKSNAAERSYRATSPDPVDYDYYDDGDVRIVGHTSGQQVKVVLHGRGVIECLDQGNFAHPLSCRKFISCAKFESGGVVGWEYTCPKGLSYDPVGGMCNWAAGLGCKEP